MAGDAKAQNEIVGAGIAILKNARDEIFILGFGIVIPK